MYIRLVRGKSKRYNYLTVYLFDMFNIKIIIVLNANILFAYSFPRSAWITPNISLVTYSIKLISLSTNNHVWVC